MLCRPELRLSNKRIIAKSVRRRFGGAFSAHARVSPSSPPPPFGRLSERHVAMKSEVSFPLFLSISSKNPGDDAWGLRVTSPRANGHIFRSRSVARQVGEARQAERDERRVVGQADICAFRKENPMFPPFWSKKPLMKMTRRRGRKHCEIKQRKRRRERFW